MSLKINPSPLLLALAALAACVERPLVDDSGASTGNPGSTGSTGDTATPTSTAGPTSDPTSPTTPTTPGTDATTANPSDPSTSTTTTSTTGPPPTTSSTTDPTVDPDTGDTSSEVGTDPKLDVGEQPAEVPGGLWDGGCPNTPPPGTAIKGQSDLGDFFSTAAYFGYTDVNGQILRTNLLFLDASADIDLALMELDQNFQITTGPGAAVEPDQQFTVEHPFWLGVDDDAVLSVIAGGQAQPIAAQIVITGHSGNWDAVDPADPPRLQGTVGPGGDPFQFSGEFDAVFCDHMANHIIAE